MRSYIVETAQVMLGETRGISRSRGCHSVSTVRIVSLVSRWTVSKAVANDAV